MSTVILIIVVFFSSGRFRRGRTVADGALIRQEAWDWSC